MCVNVHVVMVTYGERLALLQQALDDLLMDDRITMVHIVSNAASFTVPPHEKVKAITLKQNMGSAYGYKVGIEQALESDPGFIWLLDDDNRGSHGSLTSLLQAYKTSEQYAPLLAVTAQRPGRSPVPLAKAVDSSFLGFRLQDLGEKLKRRLGIEANKISAPQSDLLELATCPFGGMLFTPDLIQQVGLPREDFVLYADDLEFSGRIADLGGRLLLATEALVEDLDASWNVSATVESSLARWVKSPGDMRAFYSARNLAFLEQSRARRPMVFAANRLSYLVLLTGLALCTFRLRRLRVLFKAFSAAKHQRLGLDDEFPLP